MSEPRALSSQGVARWLTRQILFPRWIVLALWCFAAYGVVELFVRAF